MPPKLLTKSKYMDGLQCLKYLWMEFHEQAKISEPDAATQHTFEQGHEVGEIAKKLFPEGADISDSDFMGNIRQTREMLKQRLTVFEAGVSAGNLYCRVDVLRPAGDREWDIIEVKSSTKVKDVDLQDIAFQKYTCQQAGLEIRNCYQIHINNEYVRHGRIEPEKLLAMEDVTEQVAGIIGSVPDKVAAMLEVIKADDCPEVGIGRHCTDPYVCLVQGCKDFLPEDNVLELYRGGQKAFDLLDKGVLAICDIPDSVSLTASQQIQKACLLSGEAHTDKAQIAAFLDCLKYPLYYLDFETFAAAIPPFDGTRPYQNIPFQFSLHIVRGGVFQPQHFSFLAEGAEDPRPAFVRALKGLLGDSGSIIIYNQSFEKGILEEIGRAFPEYDGWVKGVTARFVDLLQPFRSFWYYHPEQKGSASLKSVLPAVTGKGYDGYDIANGEIASLEYYRVTYGNVPAAERKRVRQALLEYCKLDTEGMVWIVEELERLKGGG